MLRITKLMIPTAVLLIEDQALIEQTKEEHVNNIGLNKYQCSISDHIQPNQTD